VRLDIYEVLRRYFAGGRIVVEATVFVVLDELQVTAAGRAGRSQATLSYAVASNRRGTVSRGPNLRAPAAVLCVIS
jgi:hypothetical protein